MITCRLNLPSRSESAIILADLNGNILDSIVFPSSAFTNALALIRYSSNSFTFIENKFGTSGATLIYSIDQKLSVTSVDTIPFVYAATIDSTKNIFVAGYDNYFKAVKLDEFLDTSWTYLTNELYNYPNYIQSENGCALICGRKDQDNTTTARGFF